MLKTLFISNFRCLTNFTLDMRDRASVLFLGLNGSGKSSVQSALSVLQCIACGEFDVRRLIREEDFGLEGPEVPIRMEMTIGDSAGICRYELAFVLKDGRVCVADEKIVEADGRILFERSIGVRNEDSRFSDKIILLPLLRMTSDTSPVVRIRSFLKNMILIAPLPPLMRSRAGKSGGCLRPDCSNCIEWFIDKTRGLLNAQPEIVSAIRDVAFSDLLSYQWEPHPDGEHLILQCGDGRGRDRKLDFDGLSDGEKCFMLAVFVVFALKARPNSFCFWDEPDNYLAISEVGRFVTSLKKSIAATSGQLIMTSHNVESIQTFDGDETFVLRRTSHLEPTRMQTLSEVNPSGANFLRKLYTGDLYNE